MKNRLLFMFLFFITDILLFHCSGKITKTHLQKILLVQTIGLDSIFFCNTSENDFTIIRWINFKSLIEKINFRFTLPRNNCINHDVNFILRFCKHIFILTVMANLGCIAIELKIGVMNKHTVLIARTYSSSDFIFDILGVVGIRLFVSMQYAKFIYYILLERTKKYLCRFRRACE